jgi:phenylacetate-CoA ligase
MSARTATPAALEPIETASQDELRNLQLERLRWSLQHAYDNVPAISRRSKI